jgi:hypothetical protein
VFDPDRGAWTFDAIVPAVLRTTTLPLPPATTAEAPCAMRHRSANYWAGAMAGQDFSSEDHLDTAAFNLALWRGLKGDEPYPTRRDGRDLRNNREPLLARANACD